MKILIAFASKNGTSEECAARLAAALCNLEVDVCDLTKQTPDPGAYDMIVLGTSVRFGKLLPVAKKYIKEYRSTLLEKPLGLFLCCGLSHEYEYYYETALPRDLTAHAFCTQYFGGTLRPKKAKWWEKVIFHSMRSGITESEIDDGEYTPELPGILPENIDRMATLLRSQIKNK